MKNYCVVRTDLMSGVHQFADMVSLRFYDADGNEAEVENGVIAEVQGFDDDQREVMKAVAASSTSDLNDCVLIATPELLYDERLKALDDFINEAGRAARGYILRSRNLFSVTKEGFVDETVPEVGGEVGIGTDGKIDAAGTGLGTCQHIETAGRYTYYTIEVAKTES